MGALSNGTSRWNPWRHGDAASRTRLVPPFMDIGHDIHDRTRELARTRIERVHVGVGRAHREQHRARRVALHELQIHARPHCRAQPRAIQRERDVCPPR